MQDIINWLNTAHPDYTTGLTLLKRVTKNRYLLRSLSIKDNLYTRTKIRNELTGYINRLQPPQQAAGSPPPAPKRQQVPTTAKAAEKPAIDLNAMTDQQTKAAVEKLKMTVSKWHMKNGMLSNSLRNFLVND